MTEFDPNNPDHQTAATTDPRGAMAGFDLDEYLVCQGGGFPLWAFDGESRLLDADFDRNTLTGAIS